MLCIQREINRTKTEKITETLTQAVILVWLKKERDSLDCGAYRPISILCSDYTILPKILAKCIETVIANTPDQMGFIPGRKSFYNMCRPFYSSHYVQRAVVVLSLDAKKDFDRIEWDYLFTVLERFGFGPAFIKWIYYWWGYMF